MSYTEYSKTKQVNTFINNRQKLTADRTHLFDMADMEFYFAMQTTITKIYIISIVVGRLSL